MSFANYWNRLVSRNAAMVDEGTKMTITVASFRAQLGKAHEAGVEDGKQFMRDVESLTGKSKGGAFDDLFGSIFGRKD